MAELHGIDYLRKLLDRKRSRVLLRYRYYDMKKEVKDFGISTPPKLRGEMSAFGWCAKAVDSLADRLVLKGFKNDNFAIDEVFNLNNPDILVPSAITAALIGACSFIYIFPDDDGQPQMQVIDGSDATGVADPVTRMLFEGYAVLERDKDKKPQIEAYFEPRKTTYYEHGKITRTFDHPLNFPLLVPVVNRPDATRPLGHSRISRACMSFTQSAVRTVKRSEISAEFYSVPQKWVSGIDQDADKMEKWQATMSALLSFTKDDQGDRPTLGQFSQGSMEPHVSQLKMFAALFAGETGLTLDDIGFPTDNPSSAKAIKAGHETLRLMARRAQRDFGTGLLNAGFLAASLRDDFAYSRSLLYLTKCVWEPIFEPDISEISGVGDAIIKIQQSFPEYFNEDKLEELTGI